METESNTSVTNKYIQIINDLLVQYETNEYIKNKINNLIISLPEFAEQENKKYEEKVAKFNELVSEQDIFFKVFLSKNQYYYMPHNNLYYEYDNITFKVVDEDYIYHKLLSTITDEGKLIQWKHKTKQMMIKKIKERLLVKAIPNSETIQNVLNFCKTFFATKSDAKYFLTIIGDSLLKKDTASLYFVSSQFKKFLTIIDSICYATSGNSLFKNFITKYHSTHDLTQYRLIKTLDNVVSYDVIKNIINEIGVDLLVVAAHYSEKHGNPTGYLQHYCNDNDVKDYVLYFKNNDINKIVTDFIQSCIEVTNTIEPKINWNNMRFIWKQYLTSLSIPNMIEYDELQKELKKIIQFTSEENNFVFIGVTSKYLPKVSSFLSFWDKYIIVGDFNTEYEVDELINIYKSTEFKNININDKTMVNMINHYFDKTVEIIDNKYITNIKCNLWDKDYDLHEYIKYYVQLGKDRAPKAWVNEEVISFSDLYRKYMSYTKSKAIVDNKALFIVSKQYFENYLLTNLSELIKQSGFIYFNFVSLTST